MREKKILMLLAAAVLAARCAATAVPPPATMPEGTDRYLIDPRTGFEANIPPQQAARFQEAWRYVLLGNEAEARRALNDVRMRAPDYAPVLVAEAALDIAAGRLPEAREKVVRAQELVPNYTAARVYEAEIAYRERQTQRAYDLYRDLSATAGAPPTVAERVTELRQTLFNELSTAAQSAADAESVRLLREALQLEPAAVETRILLAQKLLVQRKHEDARREIEPILTGSADRAEVQEILAEVEVGRGRYQEAIVRYDRLARRTREPRYERRLEEIKQEWSAANMPAHYRTALDSEAITRGELAILLYWTVPSVRFAQNLGSPPIAIDVSEVAGREEMIRAIAIGLFEVDPVTRRVGPSRTVNAARFSTHLTRVLMLRGAACARGLSADKVLAACGVTDPLTTLDADAPVTGQDAVRAFEQVAKKL